MTKSGFYSKGKSHKQGGIDVLVDGVKSIEVEQFEYKICKNAMQSTKIFEFKNKTNKEILDDIFNYANCEFKQHEANDKDFILCKLTVLNPIKRNITGTCKEIVNIMQSEKSCNISNESDVLKDGREIQKKWNSVEKMSKNEAKEFYDSEEGKKLDKETYTKWKSLVNMSKSELKDFYESKDGKEAGLSASEAKEEGIDSGRESARWIMKMIDVPYTEWTSNMWRWAKKQISFISRMSGMKGDLYDDKGNKTRKHTSLLIWGHNPEKLKNGGEIKTNEMKNKKKYDYNNPIKREDETGKTINSYSVKNWDEVPQVWKNTNEIKKVNFVNSPYNKELIKIVTPFTGTDPLRPIMSGVHFDENGITCTDAHKLITLPYPNKDFNGTYATVSKKYLADAEIKKDLFTATKYPKYEAVIPKVGDAIRVHEISLYKILQYTNVAQNYVDKATYQVVYSLGDTSIGFNSKFLTEIIETALKLGHKKLYAFTRNPNNAVVFSTSKNYSLGKDEIFLLMPTIVYTSNDDVVINGAFDLDFSRELLVYYDFSKDAIVNQDGTIAEFKMNYGDYDVIKSSDIKMLKDFGGKNPAIVLLENFKVDNGKIYASYLDRYNENFLTIKNIDLKNGIYNVLDNAIEYNPNEAISGFDEFPNPKTDLGETKLKFIINSEVLTHYIKTAVDFTGNDDIRPAMMGILLDYNNKQLFLASTNAHVMFKKNITEYCEINKDIPDFQIILPKINLLKFLDNIDESPLVVTCTPNYIKFENDGYEFITKKIDGKYLAYNQVIPSYKSKKLNINIKDLFICINSDEAKSFIKESPKTDISIYDRPTTNNELDIYLGISNSESRYRESQANRSELKIEKEVKICTVNYTKEEGSFQMKDSVYLIMPMMLPTEGNFVFNVKYFREILEVCNTETLELYYDEKNRAYIIQGDALSYGKTMSGKKKEDKKKVAESEIRPIEITELKAEPKKVEAISNEELSGKTDTQLKTAIANFTKFVEGYEDILSKWKNGNSNTIDGKFYTGADIRYFKQKLPMYKEMLLEYQSELDRRSKKEQTPEQKEWQDAVSTFEELVSLGGSKKELKEWKEAIDTFKILLEDDTEQFAKGGQIGVDLVLLHNKEKAPNMGKKYGQDVEPSGYYAIEKETNMMDSNPNYETVTFNPAKPLIIDVDDDTLVSWKYELSKKYKAKGKKLSEKLMKEGYDVIITKYSNGDTGEIIILDTSKIKSVDKMAKGGDVNANSHEDLEKKIIEEQFGKTL
jgi:DNA polymerase III sliding clamp (beta) subunit (PCNA family)